MARGTLLLPEVATPGYAARVKATLYAMPASHPSMAAELMLERKAVEYRVVWLLLPFTGPILRLRGFGRRTVPALRIDGRRVQGSRAISAALDELRPEPRLFPADPAGRREVEEAERWGDEVLQPAARRIEIWELRRDRGMIATQLAHARRVQGARVPINPKLAAATSGPTLAWYARLIAPGMRPSEQTFGSCPPCSTASTAGSPPAFWVSPSRTLPLSRSPPASAC
jgi:glutathione S-transferase